MTAPTSELQYVIRDNQAIGFLLSAGPKGYRAFDADGLTLGLYESEELAAKAINEQAPIPQQTKPRSPKIHL